MSLGARRRRPPTPGFVANELWRRAGEVPSFHIAPARTGHALDLVTGNLIGSYNSASPAWAVGPDGVLFQPAANAPVIEYDPTTLQCLGARIWDVALNLSLHSRDLTQAAWSKSGITATRDQVGANGVSNTATRLTATSSDGTCLQTITSASATRVSGFYIRRITGTGTVEITQDGGATWTAVSLTGTFARYSIASATITNPQIGFRIRSNGDEIAVDFAQLQSSAILGPPVATAGVTASSTADVWSITGADAARIINTAQGTLYVDFATGSAVPANFYPTMLQLQGASRQNEVQIYAITGAVAYLVRTGNVAQAEANLSATTQNGVKSAFRYAENNSRAYVNGSPLFLDTVCTMPATDRIFIGSSNGNENFLNGYIREAAILRSGRADANLQAMTP